MKKEKIVKLALLSMFSAIIIAMTFIPYVGYITIPGMLSITTVHIMVIIGAIVMDDILSGTILGGVWGISCLIYALFNGTADAAIFLDPRISVVPRLLVGLLVVCFYKLAIVASKSKIATILLEIITSCALGVLSGYLCNNISGAKTISIIVGILVAIVCEVLFVLFAKNTKTMPIIFAALCGTFSNTLLVLFAINLFGSSGLINLTGTLKNVFSTVIALNGTIELIAAVIVALPCCLAIKKFKKM